MIPLRVTAKNYGPYRDVQWDIPAGLSAIVGNNTVGDGANSNGSGKTKLLELVPICLFGPTLPWSEYLTVGAEETTCVVSLEFEHGGETYRIRRTYDSKGRGKTLLDFEKIGPAYNEDDLRAAIKVARMGTDPGVFYDSWLPLTRGDQKDTQQLIDQTIGLSEATFAHSVFAGQGARHFADPSLPPRERKAILAEALNLGVWDELLKLARADMAETQRAVEALAVQIGGIEADIAAKGQVEEERASMAAQASLAAADVAACETAETQMRERHTALQSAAATYQALVARNDAAKGVLVGLDRSVKESADAQARLEVLVTEIAALEPVASQATALRARATQLEVEERTREHSLRERARMVAEGESYGATYKTLAAEAETMRLNAQHLESRVALLVSGQADTCDHCGQPLAGDALEKSVQSHLADVKVLQDAAEAKEEEAKEVGKLAANIWRNLPSVETDFYSDNDDWDAEDFDAMRAAALVEAASKADEAQEAAVKLSSLQTSLESHRLMAARTHTPEFQVGYRRALTEAEESARDLAAAPAFDRDAFALAGRDLERANSDVTAARATDRQIQAALAGLDERLRNLAALAVRAQEALTEKTRLQGQLDTLTALARSYGRDGIPALILETNAIPQVEQTAQTVLEQMGMPFRVELVTQRENKGGGVKDTLDVVVHEPNGPRRYETYSGGERTRLELALRIALARLIAQRSSSHCGLLALDEPSWLDATGMAQLAEVLRGLTEFRSVVLVSHDERLVEAFDNTVFVTRDENGSRLEEAA